MKVCLIIAQNTFREIIRDRILYSLLVFALVLIGLSLALGELTFAEQSRVSADFGFAGIHMCASILAIFVGSTLVSREIEKQTILTLLARPVTRAKFLIGKWIGLAAVLLSVIAALMIILAGVLYALGFSLELSFVYAVLGVVYEALILLSLAIFFGSFSRPIMTVIFSLSIFLMGHWTQNLDFFIKKSESTAFKLLGRITTVIVPSLESFNWRSAPIYGETLETAVILHAGLYALLWVALLLFGATVIFDRRDFV